MTTEKAKMLRGEPYLANDPELAAERLRARRLLHEFNTLPPDNAERAKTILQNLLRSLGDDAYIVPPFHCDYGYNIKLGHRVFLNCHCVLLDVCEIEIGDDTLLAPNVQIYAATHPLDWQTRKNQGPEFGRPVKIGADCWIGGGTILCPGVTIGERSVIGAGSVVTYDIPPGVLAFGNPCRVVRNLE